MKGLLNCVIILFIFTLSCFAEDEGTHVIGSFIVTKDPKGRLCLTSYDEYSNGPDASMYASYYYITNADLTLNDRYTFSLSPPLFTKDGIYADEDGLKITKKLSERAFEAVFLNSKENDEQKRKRQLNDKNNNYQSARQQILKNKENYYTAQTNQINNWTQSSSLNAAISNAEAAKHSGKFVFKDLYLDMPISDAVWALKSLFKTYYQVFNFDSTDSQKNSLKAIGVLRLFHEKQVKDFFDIAVDDLYNSLYGNNSSINININERLRNSFENESREYASLYYDADGRIIAFYFPKWFLCKMFKIDSISDEHFINLFRESYNISPEFQQSKSETSVYVCSLPFIFGGFATSSFSDSSVVSFIDPRGARITFSNAGGFTKSLFIQKWATPKEIKDSFN